MTFKRGEKGAKTRRARARVVGRERKGGRRGENDFEARCGRRLTRA
jgi:hypothetical protein